MAMECKKTTDDNFESKQAKNKSKVQELFKRFDLNQRGKLDRSELSKVLKEVDAATWTDESIHKLFDAIAANAVSEISFTEFLEWACSPNDALFWGLSEALLNAPDVESEPLLFYERLRREASARGDDAWDLEDDDAIGMIPPTPSAGSRGRHAAWGTFTCTRSRGGGITALSLAPAPPALDLARAVSTASSEAGERFEGTQSALGAVHGKTMTWVRGEELGRGTMGTVFRALDQSNGEVIAVKQVDESDEKFTSALENELEICCTLRHPCIVSFLGHDRINDNLYIYLEYMAGGSLADVLRQFGALDESLISDYTRAVTKGLRYLHDQHPKVLHRDIKGGNVLVGLNCEVKLADFGCSKRLDGSMAQTMRGSVPWMAPEVIMASGYGRRADMWSLGCLVIEMATAAPPWGKLDNLMLALRKIGMSTETPPIPDSLSADCKDFVSICVQRDPKERMLAADALEHRFLREDVVLEPLDE